MNLFKLHSTPEILFRHADIIDKHPIFFWEEYEYEPRELKKREKQIAKDAKFAYLYANRIINGPFKLGEEAIARDAEYSYLYAKNILKSSFPAGEEAISKDAEYAKDYAEYVLKADFYLDGKLIAKAE